MAQSDRIRLPFFNSCGTCSKWQRNGQVFHFGSYRGYILNGCIKCWLREVLVKRAHPSNVLKINPVVCGGPTYVYLDFKRLNDTYCVFRARRGIERIEGTTCGLPQQLTIWPSRADVARFFKGETISSVPRSRLLPGRWPCRD